MSGKTFLKDMLISFFVVVTLVNAAMYILGSLYMGDQTLTYDAFLSPLLIGAGSVLTNLLLYSKKELSIWQMLFRKFLQLVCIEIMLSYLIFGSVSEIRNHSSLYISFCVSVCVIYIATCVIQWCIDLIEANKLTDDLRVFQKEYEA